MITRLMSAAFAAAALLAPTLPVQAQDQGGGLVCERDLRETQAYLDNNRAQLSEQAVRDAERRLDLAKTECNSSPQIGQTTLSTLQRDLDMQLSQTAQTPGQAPAAGQ